MLVCFECFESANENGKLKWLEMTCFWSIRKHNVVIVNIQQRQFNIYITSPWDLCHWLMMKRLCFASSQEGVNVSSAMNHFLNQYFDMFSRKHKASLNQDKSVSSFQWIHLKWIVFFLPCFQILFVVLSIHLIICLCFEQDKAFCQCGKKTRQENTDYKNVLHFFYSLILQQTSVKYLYQSWRLV